MYVHPYGIFIKVEHFTITDSALSIVNYVNINFKVITSDLLTTTTTYIGRHWYTFVDIVRYC